MTLPVSGGTVKCPLCLQVAPLTLPKSMCFSCIERVFVTVHRCVYSARTWSEDGARWPPSMRRVRMAPSWVLWDTPSSGVVEGGGAFLRVVLFLDRADEYRTVHRLPCSAGFTCPKSARASSSTLTELASAYMKQMCATMRRCADSRTQRSMAVWQQPDRGQVASGPTHILDLLQDALTVVNEDPAQLLRGMSRLLETQR